MFAISKAVNSVYASYRRFSRKIRVGCICTVPLVQERVDLINAWIIRNVFFRFFSFVLLLTQMQKSDGIWIFYARLLIFSFILALLCASGLIIYNAGSGM
jgi:hypothetical protein